MLLNKKKALIILFYSFIGHCSAQSLSHSVIGTAGDTFHSSEGYLDWSLGEVMTETYTKNSKILTQGFHQIEIKNTVTEIKAFDPEKSNVVYPNPVRNSLTVQLTNGGSYQIEVYSPRGNKVIDQIINLESEKVQFQIDFHDLSPALYVLRILNTQTGQVSSFKIEKL